MALGYLRLFQGGVFAGIFILLIPAAAVEIRRFPLPKFKTNLTPLEWACAALVLYVLCLAALGCGSPPTDWDSLAYHQAFPKIFLAREQIPDLDWSYNAFFPLSSEMLYTLLLSLRSGEAAQWMNFFHGLFLLAAVFGFADKKFGRKSAWLAAALLAAQPIFLRVNGNASTDFAVTLASFLAVRTFVEGGSPRLAGLLAGAAACHKLTGLWTAAALAVLYAPRPKDLLRFACACALLGAPWYLRVWLWKGNPFWPHFGSLFGASPAELLLEQRIKLSITEGAPKTLLNFVLSPFHFIFGRQDYGQKPYYLAAVFSAFLAWKTWRSKASLKDPAEKRILLFLALFWVLWFWVYQMWRYLLPAAAWASVLTAAWALELSSNRKGARPAAAGLMLLAVLPVLTLSAGSRPFAFFGVKSKAFPGLTSRERYLEAALGPVYPAMRKAGAVLPTDARVALFGEVRGYYLDRPYAWCDSLNPGYVDYDSFKTGRDLRQDLVMKGYTHVLVNPYTGPYQGAGDYHARANRIIAEFLRQDTVPLADERGVVIARIH